MAAEFITGVRTKDKDVAIDYRFLAHKPESDKTLSIEGDFADAKVVGEKFKLKADKTDVEKAINDVKADSSKIDQAVLDLTLVINEKTSALQVDEDDEGKILRVVKDLESDSWKASWESASSALDATKEDKGKILTVAKADGDDESESWVSVWKTPTEVLEASPEHNGKILTVVNGTAKWETPANAFTPSVDNGGSEGGDGEGDEGDTQNKPGQILVNVDGAAKWESIANAIAASATEAGQFLSVDVTDTGEKIAYWRIVIDADKVEF